MLEHLALELHIYLCSSVQQPQETNVMILHSSQLGCIEECWRIGQLGGYGTLFPLEEE